jgi:hypothetical protein
MNQLVLRVFIKNNIDMDPCITQNKLIHFVGTGMGIFGCTCDIH